MLDLSNLEKALAALELAIEIFEKSPLSPQAPEKTLLRDGLIQRFEFTFELSWKTIKRYLEEYGLEEVDKLNNRELFRMGYEQGLIDDPAKWFHCLRMRNLTSHVYDEENAIEIFKAAEGFANDVKYLVGRLKEKIK